GPQELAGPPAQLVAILGHARYAAELPVLARVLGRLDDAAGQVALRPPHHAADDAGPGRLPVVDHAHEPLPVPLGDDGRQRLLGVLDHVVEYEDVVALAHERAADSHGPHAAAAALDVPAVLRLRVVAEPHAHFGAPPPHDVPHRPAELAREIVAVARHDHLE